MLIAAREAISELTRPPLLVAVTILTSMDETDLRSIGLGGAPGDHVTRLATLAQNCGLDGVVCSSRETQELRTRFGNDFRLVTPGIRPSDSPLDDQRRATDYPGGRPAGYIAYNKQGTRCIELILQRSMLCPCSASR